MKRIVIFLAAMVMIYPSFAQNDDNYYRSSDDIQTIMGKNNRVGGYGAISMQYSEIDNRDAFSFGARGALIMGRTVALGLAGTGFFNDVHYDQNLMRDVSYAGGYGGFFFEPIIMPKYPVHISIPILIGVGGFSVVGLDDDDDFWHDNNFRSQASDAFMVIEPGVEIELNVTKFFRFCVGAYYRYTTDVDVPEYNVPTDVLRGFSGGVTFKFGKF